MNEALVIELLKIVGGILAGVVGAWMYNRAQKPKTEAETRNLDADAELKQAQADTEAAEARSFEAEADLKQAQAEQTAAAVYRQLFEDTQRRLDETIRRVDALEAERDQRERDRRLERQRMGAEIDKLKDALAKKEKEQEADARARETQQQKMLKQELEMQRQQEEIDKLTALVAALQAEIGRLTDQLAKVSGGSGSPS